MVISSPEDMQQMANEWGFLPFFANEIDGFSIEEHVAPEFWFPDDEENGMGAWDWKGECIVQGDLAYGKLYKGKACYVSMEWFPDLVNWRRSRYELRNEEAEVLRTLQEHHTLLSRELKRLCGYNKPHQHRAGNPLERQLQKETKAIVKRKPSNREGFDTVVNHLQMGTYMITADFEWLYDKQGKRHGWGLARYATPEDFFGSERLHVDRSPEDSFKRIYRHLTDLLPQADDAQIKGIIG